MVCCGESHDVWMGGAVDGRTESGGREKEVYNRRIFEMTRYTVWDVVRGVVSLQLRCKIVWLFDDYFPIGIYYKHPPHAAPTVSAPH